MNSRSKAVLIVIILNIIFTSVILLFWNEGYKDEHKEYVYSSFNSLNKTLFGYEVELENGVSYQVYDDTIIEEINNSIVSNKRYWVRVKHSLIEPSYIYNIFYVKQEICDFTTNRCREV